MTEELKPCPFCGSEEEWLSNRGTYVTCGKCRSEGPLVMKEKESSIDLWNTRTEQP